MGEPSPRSWDLTRGATAALLLLAACGARSSLDVPRADGGGGTSSASASTAASTSTSVSTASTSTGTGGAGGGPCAELVQTGEITLLPALPNGWADTPKLHPIGDGRVAVVHRSALGPAPSAGRIASTTLAWTGAWPPPTDEPVLLVEEGGWSFAVDRWPSPVMGLLAGTTPQGPGVSFGFVAVDAGGWSPSFESAASATRALFVRSGKGAQWLVGMEAPGPFTPPTSYDLLVGWVHQPPNGTVYDGPFAIGCVNQPVAADGLETEEGWLIARAIPVGAICFDDVEPASATEVTVTRYTDGLNYYGLQAPLPSPVEQLAVVPRPGGGWIVLRREPSVLEVIRMDALGSLEFGPTPIAGPGSAPFAFAADAMAGGLVAAFVDDPAGNPPDLAVVVVDEQGAMTASATIEDPPLFGAPDVLVDEASRQILVAFAGTTGRDGWGVQVARFGCR